MRPVEYKATAENTVFTLVWEINRILVLLEVQGVDIHIIFLVLQEEMKKKSASIKHQPFIFQRIITQ
ncbi:hypothetical protein AVEN_89784-1, partial [Araneus ventricosus]